MPEQWPTHWCPRCQKATAHTRLLESGWLDDEQEVVLTCQECGQENSREAVKRG